MVEGQPMEQPWTCTMDTQRAPARVSTIVLRYSRALLPCNGVGNGVGFVCLEAFGHGRGA